MKNTYVRLFTGSFIEVQRLQLDLEDAEIPFIVKNKSASAKMAGFGSLNEEVEIHVPQKNLKKAAAFLDPFTKDKTT